MRAVDLRFVAIGEAGFSRRAEVESRVAVVIDFNFGTVAEILVGTLGANQHRSRS